MSLEQLKKRVRRRYPEQELQRAVVQWAELYRLPHTPDPARPKLGDWLFHIPNERSGKLDRKILSGLGVKPGVSDLMLPLLSMQGQTIYIGCWIELKAKGNKPTKHQQDWLDSMAKAGYYTLWSDDFDAVIAHLQHYCQHVAT